MSISVFIICYEVAIVSELAREALQKLESRSNHLPRSCDTVMPDIAETSRPTPTVSRLIVMQQHDISCIKVGAISFARR